MIRPSSIDSIDAAVSDYRFDRADLCVADRQPGISAFMRIRNGADFLETSIRSHIDYFDEIVAVHNQCSDQSPAILLRLQDEFGPEKLRVIHYIDRVYPPGSEGHIRTDPGSPNSLVNYYNFALAATRYQHATKLDDDHLAMAEATKAITDAIRNGGADHHVMNCFSGLNVFRRTDGSLGILASDPLSGGGDIGFFRVTPQTYFTHDRRFERFQRGGARRTFAGFLYWHLKYMKDDMGFGNYDLQTNPSSRYAKRKAALERTPPKSFELDELAVVRRPGWTDQIGRLISDKRAFVAKRDGAIAAAFPDQSVAEAIRRTVSPEFCSHGMFSDQLSSNHLKCA
jgi:hypothetical protein